MCLKEVDESFLHGGILFIFHLFRNILLTKLIRASGLPHSNFIQIKLNIDQKCALFQASNPNVELSIKKNYLERETNCFKRK